MSYRKPVRPDRMEEAGRAAVRGDREGPSMEDGSMARAGALLAPIRVDAEDERRAALTVADFWLRREQLRAAQVAEARRLLDILGLLPEPEPEPEATPGPEAEDPVAAEVPTSAERQRLAKAARIERFAALMRDKELSPEEAAAEMGLRPSTGTDYAQVLRAREQRAEYLEARGIGFTSQEAAEYAGIHPGQRKAHERAWRDRQRAARGGGGS